MCLPAPVDAAPATIVMGTVSLSSTTSAAAADEMMMATTAATPAGNSLPHGGPMARRGCGGNRERRDGRARRRPPAGWEEEKKKKLGRRPWTLRTCNGWMAPPPQNRNLRRVRERAYACSQKGCVEKAMWRATARVQQQQASSQQIMTTISRVASVI